MNLPDTCRAPQPAIDLTSWLEHLAKLEKQPADYRQLLQELKALTYDGFDQGLYIDDLIKDTSLAMDALLTHSWNQFGFGDHPDDIALAAVGGYGRQELHPSSDIDILILLRRADDAAIREQVSIYITFLWDTGLDIGQSVRTIEQCYEEGKNDVTVATNLFESRLITGSTDLYQQMQAVLVEPDFWPSTDFFTEKVAELKARHHRFADSSYRLEPNLKENPGGLRDLHTLAWITKRHFGVNTLRELIGHEFINQDEYNTLCGARDFLWMVRFGLHRISGRKDDRVLLDLQKPLSRLLGYDNENEIRAVEEMMQHYYRAVTNIARISEMLLQHFEEEILLSRAPAVIFPINERFQLRNGYLEVTRDKVFIDYPPALLEIFLLLQRHKEARGIRAATIRLIRNSVKLIDEEFRNDPRCHELFLELLRRPRGIYHDFRRMNAYGILEAYIPAFKQIVGRMQFDMFHIYTVDEHTLMVLRYVRRLSDTKRANEAPEATELFSKLRNPKLLYLAALFHDLG
ncbi:MAG TPA: [protein-PII] uridylyltransferase, partial [Gammaproteobacteria bacterium]|nr:[protein-PII] uridylyltransferase [Gammaproteobacteria bacterium]